jgi:rod shape-determining protein MreC
MFKKKLIYVVIILAILISSSYDPFRQWCYKFAADFFHPFLSAPISVNNTINAKSLLAKTKQELIAQAFKLRRKNLELEAKYKYLENLKEENDRLRNLLQIAPLPNYNYVYSEISYRDPSKWYQQFIINKGSDDGIKDGSIVIAQVKNSEKDKVQFAVVGRVGLLSKHTAVVYTLLSTECQLSVTILENGASGILTGGERTASNVWSNINYLPKDLPYKAESLVVTSGMSPLAPKGLTIGSLDTGKAASPNNKNLYFKAKVNISVDLNDIDYVLVLVEKS